MHDVDWLAVMLVSLSAGAASGDVPLVLNELMAANGAAIKDQLGQYDDWIELHNPSGAPVDAAGLYVSDDPAVPTRWQIPLGNKSLTTVPAKGFLLIWADDDATAPGLHAGFKLDAEGDAVYLFDADGSTLLDSVEFDEQIPNISFGRYPDATGTWSILTSSTPLMPNAPAAAGVWQAWSSATRGASMMSPSTSPFRAIRPGPRSITRSTAASPTSRPPAYRPEARTPSRFESRERPACGPSR